MGDIPQGWYCVACDRRDWHTIGCPDRPDPAPAADPSAEGGAQLHQRVPLTSLCICGESWLVAHGQSPAPVADPSGE